mmetsp:Transcript_9744/g.23413  ORF Transcript_9744/g.23413 Transcript_9744/m.23413 type:complete len:97 (+) Transcript_9744:578-868(+)
MPKFLAWEKYSCLHSSPPGRLRQESCAELLSSRCACFALTTQVVSIKNSDIAKHLSLPPVKLHCSMLAEDAIKAAVKDIQAKRAAAQTAAAAAEVA